MRIVKREFLRTQTRTCHASTIAFFKGHPVFAWFGGSREGAEDVEIHLQYQGEVIVEKNPDRIARWNPILFTMSDRLYIFTKRGMFCDRWQTFFQDITNIEDFGKEKPQIVPAGLNGPVKTKPLIREGSRTIFCGSSVETSWDWTSYIEKYHIAPDGSLDFIGRSNPLSVPKITYKHPYHLCQTLSQGIIQPAIWEDFEGRLHAFFRSSNGLNKIYHSSCLGDELQWESPKEIDIPNPNSSVDTVYDSDRDNLYLVYNPSSDTRSPLSLAQINDETFEIEKSIVITEAVEGIMTYSKELSYPYMILKDGIIHLCYTYGRSKIEYVQIEI